jgi:hypothetical protein
MLYATLEEAYNITSFKKPKKKKTKDVEPMVDIPPYDKYDSSMGLSDVSSNKHSRTTTPNQCDPLQAPPYIFPIEKKAKEQYEQALKDMDSIDTKIESNMGDELDSYLNDEEYNEIEELPNEIEEPKVSKVSKVSKESKESKVPKESNADKILERIYELLLLLLVAFLIVLMCEVIVRIAKN